MLSQNELMERYGKLYDEQLFNESKYKNLAEEKMKMTLEKDKAEGRIASQPLGQHFVRHIIPVLSDNIKKLFVDKLVPKRGVKPSYIGILMELHRAWNGKEDELYDICAFTSVSVMLSLCISGRETFMNDASQIIAKEIYDEFALQKYLASCGHKDGIVAGVDKRIQAFYRKAYVQSAMKKDSYVPPKWNKLEAQKIAIHFIQIVVDSTPYFKLVQRGFSAPLAIEPTNTLLDSWRHNEINLIQNAYRLCPMVIPPAPWENYQEGGYYGDLQGSSTLLRLHASHTIFTQAYLKRLDQMELTQVRAAVNAIQATPWKINVPVLEVMETIVKRGGGLAGLPSFDEALKPIVLPEKPTPEELERYKSVMPSWYRNETRRKSKALRALSHVKIARQFAKYEKIYFPCNMDFRGRIYPIPSFNFQGDDLNKSLILFADAPACKTQKDIDWLAIHGANLAGVDKVSYADRIQWVYDNEKDILASAADPLGHLWWSLQDAPCQMLAWCMEWKKWKEWEAEHGTPEGFVSGIPVAMDGTCSGLQHFSAILRDPIGGYAVNLIPGDKPNDIYAIVAEKVNVRLKEDSQNGTLDEVKEDGSVKYGTKYLAQLWLSYGVTRKVTKRNTMTLAYGAKEYGFREQIMEDTIEADINDKGEASVFNKYNKWDASSYMAKLVWEAVGKTVVKAVEGMKWLQDCAKLVTKKGNVVTWLTPLGLPVQQSYMKIETKVIQCRISNKRIRIYVAEHTGNINRRKQCTSIAPNFIHSMDGSHLQLTVLNAEKEGIKHFATVHDSYACPVAQAQKLAEVVRQSFIQLYSENDVLENFRKDMQLFSDKELPEPPQKGTLDIQQIKDSLYIFC